MADGESDVETDRLELALDTLFTRHCSVQASLKSKDYCAEFRKLVEEYTGQWQVPLPQMKVLRTALCSFTKATAAFPDDCQHIHSALSSLALSFFELMLFFSTEEFVEDPLKDMLDSFQECHSRLLRHRNVYLQQVKQVIKTGGPWESPVLQGILREAALPPAEVEEYLSSEAPVFLELRLRYLQACERVQEAMALAKSCLENREAGKHLYFHQAYLTCLYKTSLHEHLHKEMAEIDGRDAVEIICNTESVEKDELLLSLCKAFLTQQLHNGDMYYIWDLVFIWSRLYLRAHPSRHGFLAECRQLASSATNIRAIFPFIKVVTTELGGEGVQFCAELCARALQLCDLQTDPITRTLVCKTIAFLLPHDLEVCRACALLVFCQERSLEAYRTVCLLYMHPDQEPHPHNNPVRTNVRFHILQVLKERLCFDPEFWNLLTLRTHCLELISDKAMKAAVLSEMKEEEEKEDHEEQILNNYTNNSGTQSLNSGHCTDAAPEVQGRTEEQATEGEAVKLAASSDNGPLKRRKCRRRRQRIQPSESDDEPEIKYKLQSTHTDNSIYSLRHNRTDPENSSVKVPPNRQREYLSRCVKNQILKRKGRTKRWLQGLPRVEQLQAVKEAKTRVKGKKRGRKPLPKLELSYPENEVSLGEEWQLEVKSDRKDREKDEPHKENELERKSGPKDVQLERMKEHEKENGHEKHTDMVCSSSFGEHAKEESQTDSEGPPSEPPPVVPATEADPGLDGPALQFTNCPIELLHSYSLKSKELEAEKLQPPESLVSEDHNGDTEKELNPLVKGANAQVKRTWRDQMLRAQRYAHLMYHCSLCHKDFKGLNVMRHALSHLKRKKLRCILCGKRFKQLPFAKKHVLEHIDEMCKRKHSSKDPCTAETPPLNGMEDVLENDNPVQDENQPSTSDEEKPEPKPGVKKKLSTLSRDDRIIRNLRILIKKTSVLHKKYKNPDAPHISKPVDFKDEQVVIKDDVVMVKDPSIHMEEGEEAKEKAAGENGFGVDIMYQLCPSELCDRVFLRISSTLTKHAVSCHINDEKVLEKTFVWAKHKCTICLRQIQFLQQYKDHMKLHDTPLRYFCYHLDCNQRFLTHQELKDHVKTHQPLRPQCSYTDCQQLFSGLQALYDHEWRHYIPAPQREEVEVGANRQKQQDTTAPWKQRVKIEELWLQSRKGQKESPKAHHLLPSNLEGLVEVDKAEDQAQVICVSDSGQNRNESDSSVSSKPTDITKTSNGYEDEKRDEVSEGEIGTSHVALNKKSPKKPQLQCDPLNVKDLEEMSTLAEGVQQKLGEPHITEHKTFKPEDPAYATFVKAPFIRPPPSTYLDESVLSMRRRRSKQSPPKKSVTWNSKKKEAARDRQVEKEDPQTKTRQRCNKCLSSFSSVEELEKHQALNSCSALFGFDSDDESEYAGLTLTQ
ncbi:zinc finger protein 654 [Diretmus argenteus]